MRRRILILVVLALVVGGAAYGAWRLRQVEAPGDGRITLYGNVEIRDAQLAFIEEERVAEVRVDEGDRVEPGQVLARLRSDRLQAQLTEIRAELEAQRQVLRRLTNGTRPQEKDQARAAVTEVQVRVANARRVVDRLEQTAGSGASSKQALDDARAELEGAEAELSVRRAALDLAEEGPREEDIAQARATLEAVQARVAFFEKRIDDTVLRSPAAGVIESRILEVGEMATPIRPAFVLALQDPKWVRAYLPEPELGHIRRGMRARVTGDSFRDRTFAGWVGFISPKAEFTPKSVQTTDLRTQLVYEVRVWVEDPDDELRLGMPVTVHIDPAAATRTPDASPSEKRAPAERGR